MSIPAGVYAGLGVTGGVISAVIGAAVGARLSSTSERDENDRLAAREDTKQFVAAIDQRLRNIEVSLAGVAGRGEMERLVDRVGLVESRVAGIESLMRLIDPRLRPGGLTPD